MLFSTDKFSEKFKIGIFGQLVTEENTQCTVWLKRSYDMKPK